MTKLVRFGVSLEKELLSEFDCFVRENNFANRSQGFRNLIRNNLVKREWLKGSEVVGAISLVYDHARRELVNKLTSIQHDFHAIIISTQHIHLDHSNCLEVVVVKGMPKKVQKLYNALKSTKGIKHSAFAMATTGKGVF